MELSSRGEQEGSGSTPRARLVAVTDAGRRAIERALHDGVQQDLIAVSVRLQLAQRLAGTDLQAALAVLDEIRRDVRDALDRVQALARDVYPSLLDARGLRDALRDVAAASGAAVKVDAAEIGRYPTDVEAAVFFCCKAALDQSAASRGPGTTVTIRVWGETGELRLVVEGAGVELDGASDAFVTVRERIEVLGGTLTFHSATGRAEQLVATVPLA